MPKIILQLCVVAFVSLLAACSDEKLEDVSMSPEFNAFIGNTYEVIGPVDAYGIRKHSKAPVDYIVLIPPPGVEGSEVGFRIPVDKGSRITVLKVLKSNRMFDSDKTFVVKLQGTQLPANSSIRIDLFRGNEGQNGLPLNPNIYRLQPTDN